MHGITLVCPHICALVLHWWQKIPLLGERPKSAQMCLKNINNNEKHSAKLVISIFNPLHHTRDFFASSRGPNDYFGPRQPFWKSFLNFAYFEMAKNPSKSGKRIKLKSIPSFLGDVWLIKVLSEFLFGHSKCHFFVPKSGQSGKSAHFCVPKNGILGAGTKILRALL